MADASNTPYVTAAVAILTAPVVITTAKSVVEKLYARKRGTYRIDFSAVGVPEEVTLPAPPRYNTDVPPKWNTAGYQRKYWMTLRTTFILLAIIYGVSALLSIEFFVRTSPVILVFSVPALIYSVFLVRQFRHIGRRAWERDPSDTRAEIVMKGSESEVLAAALSAITSMSGRLLKLSAKAGELVFIIGHKNKLMISVDVVNEASVHLIASVEAAKPTNIQSRSSGYRKLYTFAEAFLAENNKGGAEMDINNASRHWWRRDPGGGFRKVR